MSRYIISGLLALLAAVGGAACTQSPTPTPIQEVVAIEEATSTPTDEAMVMEELTPTPTDGAMVMEEPTSTPTHEAMVMEEEPTSTAMPTLTRPLAEGELVSDIADFVLQDLTIEVDTTVIWTNLDVSPHTSTSGQPDGITGVWNSELLTTDSSFSFTFNQTGTFLYFCAIHPSFMQASVTVVESLPGEIGVIEFLPDKAGNFLISNVGHGFDATLVVVETVEEAKKKIAEREIQMYALIHNVGDSKMFPDRLIVQEGIPTTIHNISLVAEHRVSIEPFYSSEDFNVKPREISRFVFTPDQTGEFTIRHEVHGITGEFIVEEN